MSELARRLGLGKSNVHRLLTTLVAEGLVEQDPHTGGYRLGHRDVRARRGRQGAPRPARRRRARCSPSCASRPASRRRSGCSTATRSSTSTGWRAPTRCACSPRPDAGCPRTAPAPARCCSPTGPSPSARRSSPRPLARLTPHTIVDPDALRDELATVRARGWAEAINEREIGVASLAAPIRDVHGDVVAAISIGAPVARFGAVPRRRLAPRAGRGGRGGQPAARLEPGVGGAQP